MFDLILMIVERADLWQQYFRMALSDGKMVSEAQRLAGCGLGFQEQHLRAPSDQRKNRRVGLLRVYLSSPPSARGIRYVIVSGGWSGVTGVRPRIKRVRAGVGCRAVLPQ